MGALALPYTSVEEAKKFAKKLQKPILLKFKKTKYGYVLPYDALPSFIDDELNDRLYPYMSKKGADSKAVDVTAIVVTLLKEYLEEEATSFKTKGKFNIVGKNPAKQLEAVNILRVAIGLRAIDFSEGAKPRKEKARGARAYFSGVPYATKRRAEGFISMMSKPWVFRVTEGRLNLKGNFYISNISILQRYYYSRDFEKRLNQMVTKTRQSTIDIRPYVKKEICTLLKSERAEYLNTGMFLNTPVDPEAINLLFKFFKIKQLPVSKKK